VALTDPATDASTPPRLGGRALRAAFALPADVTAVAAARQRVREQLGAWGVERDSGDTAVLMVSELFTNALVHTASEVVTCGLTWNPGQLLIEVADEGGAQSAPRPRKAHSDEEGGRGLMLVKLLAEQWGVGPAPYGPGRVVWAVLRAGRA
jgi:serine/threonine-protein kinase RsbW